MGQTIFYSINVPSLTKLILDLNNLLRIGGVTEEAKSENINIDQSRAHAQVPEQMSKRGLIL